MPKRNYARRETKEYNFIIEIFQIIFVWIVLMPYVLLFYRVKIEGKENIPKKQSFLLAPTHSGYVDPVVARAAIGKPVAFMAKKELFEINWLCPFIVALGAFSVNREKLEIATIRTAQAVAKTNHWMLSMFPQGTRDLSRKITKINPGFAYLAKMSKISILPISITGAEEFSKIPFSKQIKIKIGKPFEPSEKISDTMEKWCDEIVALGDYEVCESAKENIAHARAKEKNESTASKG